MDAQVLARLARVDPALLYPIRHRGERVQQHLAMVKARAGSSTTPDLAMARDLSPSANVAFPLTEQGRHPVLSFRSSITQPTDGSIYASPAASRRPVQDSRSGWSRFSFPVGLFHPLQRAGLSRRTLAPVLGYNR